MLEALSQKYQNERETLSSFDLAMLELEIFRLSKSSRKEKASQGKWLAKLFGVSPAAVGARLELLNQGEWVKRLWKDMDNGLAPTTATRLMRFVREQSEDMEKRVQLLNSFTEEFLRTKKFPTIKAPANRSSIILQQTSKGFLSDVEVLARKFADECNLENTCEKDILVDDFITSIKVAIEDFRRSVYKKRKEKKEDEIRVGRRTLAMACEVLGITCNFGKVPTCGWNQARVIYSKRAAQLHPDKNNGSEATVSEYQRVIESWEALKTYRRQIEEQ